MAIAPEVERVRSTILESLQKVPLLFRGHLREIAAATLGICRKPGIDPKEFRLKKKRAYGVAMEAIEPLLLRKQLRCYQRHGAIYAGRPTTAPSIIAWQPGDPLPLANEILEAGDKLVSSTDSALFTGYYLPPDQIRLQLQKQLFSSIIEEAERRQPRMDDEELSIDRRSGASAIVAFRIASLFTSLLTYAPDDVSTFELTEEPLLTQPQVSPEAFTIRDGVKWSLYLANCWRRSEAEKLVIRHRDSQVPFQIYPA